MPRPRVKDENRKRVARACDTCKRRKEKCDGSQPCLLCKRRAKQDECHYSDGKRPSPSRRQSTSSQPSSTRVGETLSSSRDAEIAVESLLTLSGNRSAARTPRDEPRRPVSATHGPSHAPVPKLSRLLHDGHGKFIFVGDSSTLAFLQNVRRLVKTAIGECALTTDPKRHAMVEAIPDENADITNESVARIRPTRPEAQKLVNSYLLATSGIIDLFDQRDVLQHLLAWTEDPTIGSESTSSIFYLVLAIGAQNQSTNNDEQAAFYFKRGRELATSSFMDDPSVLTVQSYILIAFYMLSSCRRNGAFMLLGIAIRAAYALGLHRSDISVLFEIRERETRERVWKSLRVLDMFLSASLGRPPATSEVDGGNVSWEGTSRGYEDIRLQALHSSAMLRICFIFERALNEVYCRREVSVQLVDSISRQYRDWNLHLDEELQADGQNESPDSVSSDLQRVIGLAHLKGAYYWSIILLTRPFLIFDVSSRLRNAGEDTEKSKASETLTLSEACIDAALRSIEIASDFVHNPDHPRRPIFVTNSAFVSCLVLALAMLGDYDKSFPLASSLEQVKKVLATLSKTDPAARRFFMIAGYLQQAVSEHIKRRDTRQMMKRRQGIQSIFGNIMNKEPSVGADEDDGRTYNQENGSDGATSDGSKQAETEDLLWQRRTESEAPKRDMTITTSGILTSSAHESQPNIAGVAANSVEQADGFGAGQQAPFDGGTFLPYTEEFPLFSLMNEFDSTSDPFFMDFAQGAESMLF